MSFVMIRQKKKSLQDECKSPHGPHDQLLKTHLLPNPLFNNKCIFKASHMMSIYIETKTQLGLCDATHQQSQSNDENINMSYFVSIQFNSIQFKQKSSMACCNKFDHVLGILNVRSNSPNGRYVLHNRVLGHWQNKQEIHD